MFAFTIGDIEMALVRRIYHRKGQISKQGPQTISMQLTIGIYNNKTAVRIGSSGSTKRKTKKKPSQVYVLDEKIARQLCGNIKSTFGF